MNEPRGGAPRRRGGPSFGFILLVAGIAAVAIGWYLFDADRGSIQGTVGRIFNKKTEEGTQALALMVGGGAAALFGLYLTFFRRSRRR